MHLMRLVADPSARSQKSSCWHPAMQKQVSERRVSPGCSTQHSPAPSSHAIVTPQPPQPLENLDWCCKGFCSRGFSFQGEGNRKMEMQFAILKSTSSPRRSFLRSSISGILHNWSHSAFFTHHVVALSQPEWWHRLTFGHPSLHSGPRSHLWFMLFKF